MSNAPTRHGSPRPPGSFLGLDIGGTKTAIAVGTHEGVVLGREVFASHPERGFDAFFSDLCEHTARVMADLDDVSVIGVSIGGPVDAERGVVCGPPNLPGWNDVPLRELLEERFALPVGIEHDAKAGALAEWMFGAGRGVMNMVFLTLGTGLGAGIIADGRLVRGAANAAGEVGHWRVAPDGPLIYDKRGSWEGWSSGTGVAALARWLHPDLFADEDTAAQVGEQARSGCREAQAIITQAGRALGRGLALLLDLLAPEAIVLGNLARRLGPAFLDPALDEVRREALPALLARCRIVCGELGESIGDVAALCVAIQTFDAGRQC